MSVSTSETSTQKVLQVNPALRWQVYQRLQELDISCECLCYQPLYVKYTNTTEVIQIWSVVRQMTASRSELIGFLNNCWN